MIADALNGKIDLIVTKSVSRFARNTVDSLVTIRQLKASGIECYFEKEQIYTFDSKGELLLTIMSSLAQEESRSISENTTWGRRKQFSDGKFSVAYSTFLGYEKGEDGKLKIVESEAKIIRLIYKLFLMGRTPHKIARMLEDMNIKSPTGKEKWSSSTVKSILKNEKYKGDALLQKSFTVDFLQKTVKKNAGELPQYYIEGCHDYIIEPKEWERVQFELKRRKELGHTYSGNDIFATKFVCECCGGFFGKKVWHSTDKYRTEIWRCNGKFKGKQKCKTGHYTTDEIKEMFLRTYTEFMGSRESVIEDCAILREMVGDTKELDTELERQNETKNEIAALISELVKRNASTQMEQSDFQDKYNNLVSRYEKASERYDKAAEDISKRKSKAREIQLFIDLLGNSPLALSEWDDELWIAMVDKSIIHTDGSITFKFRSGTEIRIERT